MRTLVLLAFILAFSFGYAQTLEHKHGRNCGTHEKMEQMKRDIPNYATDMQIMESQVSEWIKNNPNYDEKAVITIPVVVHVLYKTTNQNISDAQIQSQIAVLNKDFMRLNTDASNTPSVWTSIAANCNIQFCLAKRDPLGATTNGITRTQTTKSGFDIYTDEAKYASKGGHDVWDRTKYLNLWVVPAILEGTQNTGILGYAQMPGGPATTDGVVIANIYFGTSGTAQAPFNKGRTATHEIGHWLNLYHIWGDDSDCSGSDIVNDTPNQELENYGAPTFPLLDGCATASPGVMFMNYMDYTNDGAMNMFTNGQKTRMLSCLNGARASLKTSTVCSGVGIDDNIKTTKFFIIPNPANEEISISYENTVIPETSTIQIFSSIGQCVMSLKIEPSQFNYQKIDIRNLSKGVYFIKIDLGNKMEIKPFIKL